MKRTSLAAVLAVLLLAACGGGGGGGSPSAPPAGGDGPTGLVPAGATPGAVLVDRASTLRPVAADAHWHYRFNDYTGPGPGRFVVSSAAGAGTAVVETASDDPQAPTTVSIDPASGSVSISSDLVLAAGAAPIRVQGFELRSPVRTNDQYVLVDRRVAASGLDVDGDARQDALDLAIYRTVVGEEAVQLPNGMAPLAAVRVDTVLAARIIPSAGGASQTLVSRQSTWYAAGLGAIRQVTHADAGAPRPFDVEAWLTGFESGGTGWGAVVRDSQFLPGGGSVGRVDSAAKVADGVLATSASHVVKLDRSGRVVSAVPYGQIGSFGQLVATTSGVRLMSRSGSAYRIVQLSDNGAAVAGAAPVDIETTALEAPNVFFDVVGLVPSQGGGRFWLVWQRQQVISGTSQTDLRVLGHDADGRPVTPVLTIPAPNLFGGRPTFGTRSDDALLLSWSESPAGIPANTQALVDADGSLRWRSTQPGTGLSGPCCLFPLSDRTGTWLTWRTDAGGGLFTSYGVRLDDAGQFVGVATDASAFTSERLTALDEWFSARLPLGFTVADGRFFAATGVGAPPYADSAFPTSHLAFAEFDLGAGSLASGLRVLRRIPLDPLVASPVVAPVVLDDRVLFLSDDGSALRPAVVWR